MKAILGIALVICFAVTVQADDPESASESRVRIGILNLDQYNKASDIAEKVQYDLIALFKEIGFFHVGSNQLQRLKQKNGASEDKKEGAPMAPSKRKEKEECVFVALLRFLIDTKAGSL